VARGWESKAVEAQQEERNARGRAAQEFQELSPEARARRERADSLKLSRARTLEQLERATTPAHRAMLKRTLLALEKELSGLEEGLAPS
jgi:predicted ArsR family transcriptional regulator